MDVSANGDGWKSEAPSAPSLGASRQRRQRHLMTCVFIRKDDCCETTVGAVRGTAVRLDFRLGSGRSQQGPHGKWGGGSWGERRVGFFF